MFIVGLFTWWYGAGWRKAASVLVEKFASTEDAFSIDLLLKTLFSPFRQISADGANNGTFQDKMRAWFDKQFSRVIGAIVRTIVIIAGTFWMLVLLLVDVLILLLWPLLPFMPLIGLILSTTGWVPWRL